MLTRREMKKRAKHVVRKHYGILLVACLVAAFLGVEFNDTLNIVQQYRWDITAEEVEAIAQSGLTTGLTPGSGNIIGHDVVKDIVKENGSEVLGRSKGVFAGIINAINSGSLMSSVSSAARSIGLSANAFMAVFIILALILFLLVWVFVINTYRAIVRRIFLESRTYEKVPLMRVLFLLRVNKWTKVSFSMFMVSLFQILWDITVVGGIIKHYSYFLVPYIVAENPDIDWRRAINLSRNMMYGHKWECFVYELSFLPWFILGHLTMGLTNLFFTNQYETAAFSEYYTELRRISKEKQIGNSHLLNDTCLFEKVNKTRLEEAYADIMAMEKESKTEVRFTGFSGFLARILGITILNREDERKYEASRERSMKIDTMEAVIKGEAYPGRLFPIREEERNSRVEHLHYLRHYSIPSLILLFFIFSFVGWAWEVTLHLITDGELVNRGFMRGPWLPIYGSGGVLILVVLNKLRKKPWLEFIAIVVLCGCVEYFTSYVLETLHNGQKWWDYSGYFLNLNGRICAEGLLVFGLGGMAFTYFAAPLLDNYLRKIKYRYAIPLCTALLIVFMADHIYSQKHPNAGEGITEYTGAAVCTPTETQEMIEEKED